MLSSITGNGWALIGAALAVILAGCGSAYGVGVAGQAAAEAKGGKLVLKKEPKAIPDGFVLVYGGVEENCTLKALFDVKKDQLQDKVNEILFL